MNNELNELIESLCQFAKVAKKEVDKIVQKGDLTPAELENVYKIACATEKIQKMCNGEMYSEGMPGSYGMSGWRPEMVYGMNSCMQNGSWGQDMYSGNKMRSPVTGRYISRGDDGGYSGHSIEDRMIASLEQQMDEAKSDYERKVIMDEIQRIRRGTNR